MRCQRCGRYAPSKAARALDVDEVKRLAARYSVTRAAEFAGVHRSTLVRFARRHQIAFHRRYFMSETTREARRTVKVGERNPNAKLKGPQALAIMESRQPAEWLARRYGISTRHVSKIRRNGWGGFLVRPVRSERFGVNERTIRKVRSGETW